MRRELVECAYGRMPGVHRRWRRSGQCAEQLRALLYRSFACAICCVCRTDIWATLSGAGQRISMTWNASASRPSGSPPISAVRLSQPRSMSARLSMLAGLALVGAQRGYLAVEGVGDVHEARRLRAAGYPDLVHGPRIEAVGGQFGKGEGVPRVRVNSVQARRADCTVVGVAGRDPVVVPLRRRARDAVGPDLPDHPGQIPAQVKRGSTLPSGYPRNRTSLTPTHLAAAICSAWRDRHVRAAHGRDRCRPRHRWSRCSRLTSMPASVHVATVPASPKSTSSGWAATTRIRHPHVI